ncbi:SDR family oxidoreductase [Stutzerimonas nitrititolerans]|uniref:SDR family oxidoreductase n=1 Tax=Stutzerimonas nitrititolerans TaxID=2482751 RepID=A0AA41WDU6_9GAMM|nr:SDR family oxidoreductase [Stutzerimonas nitrititolerans]MCO7543696.1 SDR family oxidoreductase [Stutzerimonas nitrititolerans]RMH98690.1 SDR family oxidoreductase [Stutzerimonas nitrititolerans]RRV22058.1 glucose 1-dehydrogenase [Pseudomonas sp. s199]WAD27194.1 SDR family oxidoreductase [Pseudomonadaceae bacterium T75]
MADQKQTMPPQQQPEPGKEDEMTPRPEFRGEDYKAAGKLQDKVAIITGGDSGIGRSVAVLFAREGADVVILYLDQYQDADETRRVVEQQGRRCLTFAGDVADQDVCRKVVDETVATFGKLDILVNNAAEQHPQKRFEDVTQQQWEKTFRTNVFGMFQMTQAALPHLGKGASIINTTSVTAYKGNPMLIDYSSTKGAIVGFTRALSMSLVERGIRVNGVAPGPIWTPLIPSTFDADKVAEFGANVPLKRPGQPEEVAPAYVYLASSDSSYVTGQVIHVNGGTVVNG